MNSLIFFSLLVLNQISYAFLQFISEPINEENVSTLNAVKNYSTINTDSKAKEYVPFNYGISLCSHMQEADEIKCLYNTIAYAYQRLDILHQDKSNNYIMLRVPMPKQRKRFLGTLIAGVTGFVVKSGIWSAFKFSCNEFLKYTGAAILGEIFDKFYKPETTRPKRGLELDVYAARTYFEDGDESMNYRTISRSDFSDGCDSRFDCNYNWFANQTEHVIRKYLPHIPRGKCEATWKGETFYPTGGLNIRTLRKSKPLKSWVVSERHELPPALYQGVIRDFCFLAEVVCVVPIKLEMVIQVPGQQVLGCGNCGLTMVSYEYVHFNITNMADLELCQNSDVYKIFTEDYTDYNIQIDQLSAPYRQMYEKGVLIKRRGQALISLNLFDSENYLRDVFIY